MQSSIIKRHFSSRVFSHSAIARAVRVSCLAGSLTVAALAGSTGLAADSDAENAQTLQEVTVTGSLIRRTDTETASPVQVIDATQLANSGFDSLSSVMAVLSANGAGQLSANNSEAFAGGASGIALRGLSVGATLVLIDGHRLAPYPLADDGERQFTDIQSIPIASIDKIEILKDGASSIYGSDAIAGVVNIILKKEITGVHVLAEQGWSQHGGGGTEHVALSAGTGDLANDGFNAYVTAEFRQQGTITLAQRSDEPWGNTDYSRIGGLNLTPGAPNVLNAGFPGTITPYLVNPNTNAVEFLGTGCNATELAAGQCTYASPQRLLAPTRGLDLLVGVTKEFNGGWEVKFRGSVFDSSGQQNGATVNNPYSNYPGSSFGGNVSNPIGGTPTPAIGSIANYLVPANFPGNTFGVPAYLEGAIPVGLGLIDIDGRTYRVAIDVTGNVLGWDTTSSLGVTKVQTHLTFRNYVNYDNLYTALTTFNAAGQPLFNPLGGNSTAIDNYVAPPFTNTATDTLNYLEFDGSRKLFDLPGGDLSAATGVSVVDKYVDNPGPAPVLAGTQGGTFSTYAIGGETDSAAFVELDAHLLHQLEVTGALRDDYYNTYGNSLTPKFGFVWKPLSLLSLRGTLSKGFRAPSPAEIGQSSTVFGLGGFQDPILCPNGVATANGTVPAACSESIGFVQRTNPLKPEKSTSYTGGFVVEPLSGLSGTFDYYHIQIADQIVSASELPTYSFSGANCVRGPDLAIAGVEENGKLVTAVPLVGPLDACFAGYVNAQSTRTSGFDLEGEYKFKLGASKLTANVTYTHVISYSLTSPDGTTYELVGTHGPSGVSGDTGNQRDRINGTFTWGMGPLDLAVSTYWISSYKITDPSVAGGSQDTCAGAFNAAAAFATEAVNNLNSQYCSVKAFTSTNLTASFKITHFLSVTGAIDNVFDAKAPIDAETYGGSFVPVNPSVDEDGIIGRFFRIGLKANL
jgi:iron complex outermembrane receptor protein